MSDTPIYDRLLREYEIAKVWAEMSRELWEDEEWPT